MRKLQLRTDGKAITSCKQGIVILALSLIVISRLIDWSNLTVIPVNDRVTDGMFLIGCFALLILGCVEWLLSRFSPIKQLAIRKKLILFTRMFLKSEEDGKAQHSVKWLYSFKNGNLIVHLYPNGLVKDTVDIGRKLSEYLEIDLIQYEHTRRIACYELGRHPDRYDGIDLLGEGITELHGRYTPHISYTPIPIYDNVSWNFDSEALHLLLIAPTGAGKTMLLNYLGGMVLKRQHKLYVVDAKNSSFGALFRKVGVPVATTTEEIICLLTELVEIMEKRYEKHFATENSAIDDTFATLNLEGHVLIFDELLSVLSGTAKKERDEIVRLLGQIALKGRAAGIALVISAQKLLATDLQHAITGQCQTRIILGPKVSDETYRMVTDSTRKELIMGYEGHIGKGYAFTPEHGLSYVETPLMDKNSNNYLALLQELRNRGLPYGMGE